MKIPTWSAILAALALTLCISRAAPITWGNATDTKDKSQLIGGVTHLALNGGGDAVSISGVGEEGADSYEFDAADFANLGPNASFVATSGGPSPRTRVTDAFMPAGIATTGDAMFDALIGTVTDSWGDPGGISAGTLTISNLEVDKAYQVQVFFADARTCCDDRVMLIDGVGIAGGDGADEVQANHYGQHVIGSFTADGPTQDIPIEASGFGNVHFNAIIVAEADAGGGGNDFQDLGQHSIDDFDHSALGPWSDIERTTLAVPKVPNNSIVIDGAPSSDEYGGFIAQEVIPTVTGWILSFPADRAYDNVDDSNFRFWLAHDDTYFYIGVDVTDDVVNVDNENARNWLDDSIELRFDALNTRYDLNPSDSSDYGGHDGIAADGSMRGWDPVAMAKNGFGEGNFAQAVDWTYGEDGDVWAVGNETDTGYALDIRYHKRLFENPDVGNKLDDDYVMGFNITVDDDDKHGDGPNGDGTRANDEDLSYYWAQRERLVGWTPGEAENFTADEIARGVHEEFFERRFDPGGRLSDGATGEVIFTSGLDPNIFGTNVADLGKGSSIDDRPGSVKIRNIGSANMLNISAVNITGPDKDKFAITSALPLQIAPLSTGELKFSFNGNAATGAFTANLEVMSDDPGEPIKVITVSASAVDPAGPAARYPLDEGEGMAFLDITGNGRNAEAEGAVTIGQAALASGSAVAVSGGAAVKASARGFEPFTDFSISLWLQANELPAEFGTVIGKGEGDSPTLALLLSGGDLSLLTGNADGLLATTGAPITAGGTHHIVFIHDETNGEAALYVDGAEVSSEAGLDPLSDTTEGFLYFGSYRSVLPLNANFDEIQVYDRVLTAEDVAFLHTNPGEAIGTPGPVKAGWVAVSDLEGLNGGTVNEQGGWTSTAPDTTLVEPDPSNAANQVLSVTRGGQNAYLPLGTPIPAGSTGTVFFRARASAAPDLVLGTSDVAAPDAWDHFEGYMRLAGTSIDIRDGGGFAPVIEDFQSDTWYNFWLVVDNEQLMSTLHFSLDSDPPTPAGSGAFRMTDGNTEHGDLINFLVRTGNAHTSGFVDDIYVDGSGENLTIPDGVDTGGGMTTDEAPEITNISRTAAGVALSLPEGTTYDIEFSTDLVTWEPVANDVTGTYEDSDAARTGAAIGFYRGVVN